LSQSIGAFGQCIIKAQRVACKNDFVSFEATTTSGTITAWNWNFGTYGNSSNQKPVQTFSAQGTLVVSCTLTLAGGSTCIDTHTIVILPNPTAFSSMIATKDTCSNYNKICMKNLCQKGAKGLASLTILWGDGGITKAKAPLDSSWCYSYADSGTFKQSFEVADSAGCKDKFNIKVRIEPSPKPTLSNTVSFFCDSSKICFTANPVNGKKFKYQWSISPNSKNQDTTNPFCVWTWRGLKQNVSVIVSNEFGCRDTVKDNAKAPDSGISYTLLNHRLCNAQISAGLTFNANDLVEWTYNGKSLGSASFMTIFSAKKGWNYMKISTKNPCLMTYVDSFYMSILNIKAKIYNETRLQLIDTFWGIDLSKNALGSRIRRLWNFGDKNATQCTTWTKKKYFVKTNCNYSKDSIAWHYYKDTDCLFMRLTLYDSSTGCVVDTTMRVYRKEFCQPMVLKNKICLGEYEYFSISDGLQKKIKYKNYLLTDILKKRDSLIFNTPSVSYFYKTPGIKSPVFVRFYEPDTVWTERNGKIVIDFIRPGKGWVRDTLKNAIQVLYKPNAEFKLLKINNCNPSKVEVRFKDSSWLHPDKMIIDWGDTTEIFSIFPDTISKLKPISHTYPKTGRYTVAVTLLPKGGCAATFKADVDFGNYTIFGLHPSCGNRVCFKDTVQDFDGKNKWNVNYAPGKLLWDFGDGKTDTGFNMCHTFVALKSYKVKLTVSQGSGCVSTFSATVNLSKTTAGIKHQPTIYCSEIRQYFDSSIIIGNMDSGKIIKWNWNFGDGTPSVGLQNPAHIFATGGVYKVRLIITTIRGCKDTAFKDFSIVGPVIKASILGDSIGCAPFKPQFNNLSKNSADYIWEYGDINNNFYSTKKDTIVAFQYNKPGIYFVHLTGGDSFYNLITGSRYFCSVRYPTAGLPQLRIAVLPSYNAAFSAPDTVCEGDSALFKNNSDTTYINRFVWQMGDGNKFAKFLDSFRYKFNKKGNYNVMLKTDIALGTPCSDSALKNIKVLVISPSFEIDCKKSAAPILYFENTTQPKSNNYIWTLSTATDTLPKMLSIGRDLMHDFGLDTGRKTICLRLNAGEYCKARTCKSIVLNNGIYLANVFTPGNIDGLNDTYKVPIYGYQDFDLRIFNRWGEILFHTDDPYMEWNGKVNNSGAILPTATYFYQVQFKDKCDQKMRMISGSINLIR